MMRKELIKKGRKFILLLQRRTAAFMLQKKTESLNVYNRLSAQNTNLNSFENIWDSSNNDSLQKHQSESAFTGWRHRFTSTL